MAVQRRDAAVGRKRMLSREDIVRAAARLLQREGYEALTIRGVAAELGVKSASLYWHFDTKDALEDLLADELMAGAAAIPVSDDWRDNLRRGSLHLFHQLLGKRDAGRVLAGRFVAGPHALRWMEAGLGPFLDAGLSRRDAAFAAHAVHVLIVGFVIFETSNLSGRQVAGATRETVLDETRGFFARLPAAEFPNLVALADELTVRDRDGRFLYGLDCLIAGIEAKAR